jgi:hypothetical protein
MKRGWRRNGARGMHEAAGARSKVCSSRQDHDPLPPAVAPVVDSGSSWDCGDGEFAVRDCVDCVRGILRGAAGARDWRMET